MTDPVDDPVDQQHPDSADRLQEQLRAADPASSLAPAPPEAVARLLEDTMTDDRTEESRRDGTTGRSRLTWVVAAAAVVLIALGGVLALTWGDDDATDPAPPMAGEQAPGQAEPSSAPPGGGAPSITELTFDEAAVTGRCRPPQDAIDVVAQQTVAVDATVTSISGSLVTLEPSRWYAGDPTDEVVVRAPGPGVEALLAAVAFEEGERYLVSATDGVVTVCGFSAPWTPELAGVYDEAFS
ncbi:hypothetical protein [Nocardioides litoris]|uniref:hypothetical protein n=1 Tax=Nocardioides litoris TaxID=1926648 RepID=UPI00111DAF94|nr:hypothetical protein [Nocardioides litoris]